MRKKTSQRVIEQGHELSDTELEQAVGGTGLQGASVVPTETETAEMLKLQMAMQRENQVFTSVSNVLKTRHDTAKNSINNIR
jgi:hypothetical protein